MNFGWIPSANAHQQKSNVIKLRELLATWKTASNEKFPQDKWRTTRERERESRASDAALVVPGAGTSRVAGRLRAHTHKLDWLIPNFCFRGHWLTPSNYFIEKVEKKKRQNWQTFFLSVESFSQKDSFHLLIDFSMQLGSIFFVRSAAVWCAHWMQFALFFLCAFTDWLIWFAGKAGVEARDRSIKG